MRRSNPVGGFYKSNHRNHANFNTANPKSTQQDESTISDQSNVQFSKSDAYFHKHGSK